MTISQISTPKEQRETNTGSTWEELASVTVFGPENRLDAGYYRRDRENTDPTLNDSTDQRPFASFSYWFNVQHGIRLDYTYTDVELSLDEDFTGHAPGVRYLHRFRPQTIGYVGTTYTTRDYAGLVEDYNVRNGFVGLDHAFSPEYSVNAEAGYFIKVPESSDKTSGPSFNLDLTRVFSRGNVTLGVGGGWDENYFRRTRLEFGTTFRNSMAGFLRGRYEILENLSIFGGASFRWSKDDRDIEEDNFRGNLGLRWSFMRWFSLALEYQYGDRNSDRALDDYSYNRVMLTLRATMLEKWEW